MGGGPSFPIDAKSWSITGRQHGTHCNLLTRTLTQPLRDTDLDTGGQGGGARWMKPWPQVGTRQHAYKLWRECQAQHHHQPETCPGPRS